ncbi:MAG: hypothetical protein KF787_09035 [Phycisphaeraceae bacterium]|nr:hypothetical protein [Phycisphaerae bacterium]MBX3392778.1 hypothetical protein [Phycisphaeraceae bacterium]
MSPSAEAPESDGKSFAQKQYNSVISEVRDADGRGLPGEVAAARLLQAESELGLTEASFSLAARLEREADNKASVLRSVLATWVSENAEADAASLYDPAEAIRTSEQKAAEFDAKSREFARQRDDLAAQIKDFETRASAQLDQARAQDVAIAGLRDQAATVSATQAARLIEQAAERRKQTDQVRTQGSLLQMQADQLQPRSREAGLMVEQFEAQARTHRDAITDMKARDAQKKALAAASRASARAAAQEIDSQLAEIARLRSTSLSEAYDATIRAFQAANSSIAAARQDASLSAARVTEGKIRQGLGDAHWSRAHGLLRYEGLLRRLSLVVPALPNAADYEKRANEAAQEAVEALSNAKDAYEAASGAYRGAKVRGEAKAMLDMLAARLEAIARITDGQGLDALASLAAGTFKPVMDQDPSLAMDQDPGSVEPGADAEPSDASDGLSATLDQLLDAIRSGNQNVLNSMVNAPNQPLRSLVVSQLNGVGTLLSLDAACMEKFQARFSDRLVGMMRGMGQEASFDPARLATLATARGADLQTTISGNSAEVTVPGLLESLDLENDGVSWKITVPPEAAAAPANQIDLAAQITAGTNEVMSALASQVRQGAYSSIDEVLSAFNTMVAAKLMPIMQRMQGGGG